MKTTDEPTCSRHPLGCPDVEQATQDCCPPPAKGCRRIRCWEPACRECCPKCEHRGN